MRNRLSTLALATMAVPAFGQNAQPNIIVFLVDDMGWEDTSVPFHSERTQLNDRYRTPNMERMAQMGVKFTSAYAAAVSSPSRCSIMTGMNPARHGVTNWIENGDQNTNASGGSITLPAWNWNGIQPANATAAIDRRNSALCTTLPEILSANGYRTIHCGKGNFGAFNTTGQYPHRLGFDVNIAGSANGSPGSYLASNEYGTGTHHVEGLDEYRAQGLFLTEALTRAAIKEMDKAVADSKPFYLYFAHYAIHTPYDGDNRFTGNYGKETDPMLGTKLNTSEINHAALIEGMDKSLGDVLDYLGANDELAKNTIVMFMSDNGGQALSPRQGTLNRQQNYPLRGGKGSAYMGGVREPMMVMWQGVVEGGTVNDNRVIIEDYFPTILEMASVSSYTTHQTVDGKSFVDILRNPSLTRDRVCIWHYPNRWGESTDKSEGYGSYSAIMKGDYHLIYFWENQERRLYNIREDIGEQNDLAASQPDLLQALAEELTDSLIAYGAARPKVTATGEEVNWPKDAKYVEVVANGEALTVRNADAFKLSTADEHHLYTIRDNRPTNFYWTCGSHQGYPAVQANTVRTDDSQLFYFMEGEDAKHFHIYTAKDEPLDYVSGKAITAWNATTTETCDYVQYGVAECGEFELIFVEGQTTRYGLRIDGDYLCTRGTSHGTDVNMRWVIRDYSGFNAATLKIEVGGQFLFTHVRTDRQTQDAIDAPTATSRPVVHDLQGRTVTSPRRGIYITDRRKLAVSE